jgi:large subunit ribosomal protein L23
MGIFGKKNIKDTSKDVAKEEKNVKQDSRDLTIEEITSEKKDKKQAKQHIAKTDTKDAYKVLIKPIISEKAAYLKAENKYLFQVNCDSTKNEIKKAIFHVYGMWPQDVNTVYTKGKKVRYGKHQGTTKDKKKAIVTLKKGDSIEIYEGV